MSALGFFDDFDNTKRDTPRFEVTVGGIKCTQAEPEGLESLIIEDHVDMIGVAHISLGLGSKDWNSVKVGDDLVVKVGSSERRAFVGVVTGVDYRWDKGGHPLCVISGMDPLVFLAASKRTETYEEMTDSAVVTATLGKAGVQIGNVEGTPDTYPYTMQRNESDLEFIKRLASRNNCVVNSMEGKIYWQQPQFSTSSTTFEVGQLLQTDFQQSTKDVPPSVTVYGWDYKTKEQVVGTCSSIDPIGKGEPVVGSSALIWKEPYVITDEQVDGQSGANNRAKNELNRLSRQFLKGKAMVEGTHELFAGCMVEFEGHRDGFNSGGFVISTRQTIEPDAGFMTEVTFVSNTFPT